MKNPILGKVYVYKAFKAKSRVKIQLKRPLRMFQYLTSSNTGYGVLKLLYHYF